MLSLVHVLEWRAAVNAEAIALTDHQGAQLSYAELAAAMQRSAAGLVITGGENVFPAEVEAVLARHPAVAEVAVIGIPDDRWGETVHAVVVPAPGCNTDALVSWARERLAGFKCPTGVTVVQELPRNATGKVLRAALREPFWAGRERLVS